MASNTLDSAGVLPSMVCQNCELRSWVPIFMFTFMKISIISRRGSEVRLPEIESCIYCLCNLSVPQFPHL